MARILLNEHFAAWRTGRVGKAYRAFAARPLLMPGAIGSIALLLYLLLIPFLSSDAELWFIPWLKKVISIGPVESLAAPLLTNVEGVSSPIAGNYTPPYMYVLIAFSFVHPFFQPSTILKLVSIAGTVMCCTFMYRLLRTFVDEVAALRAAVAMLLLPTVALNGAAWGQSDAIYAGFILLAVSASLRDEYILMMVAFGLGVAFKLQTIFIAPFILCFMISRRVPLWTVLIPPVVYALMMVPAWLAGRTAWELATIYLNQGDAFKWLSMNAPNPWSFVQYLHFVDYKIGLLFGLLLAAFGGLAVASVGFLPRLRGADLILLALISTTLMP